MAINYSNDYCKDSFYNNYYQSEPWEHAEERFRKRFELHVEKSKRHYRHKPIPISYQAWNQTLPINHEYEREPLLKIYISNEHYEQLVKGEQQSEELERELRTLRNKERDRIDEMNVRTNNPALRKAWENYQMLLTLVR